MSRKNIQKFKLETGRWIEMCQLSRLDSLNLVKLIKRELKEMDLYSMSLISDIKIAGSILRYSNDENEENLKEGIRIVDFISFEMFLKEFTDSEFEEIATYYVENNKPKAYINEQQAVNEAKKVIASKK